MEFVTTNNRRRLCEMYHSEFQNGLHVLETFHPACRCRGLFVSLRQISSAHSLSPDCPSHWSVRIHLSSTLIGPCQPFLHKFAAAAPIEAQPRCPVCYNSRLNAAWMCGHQCCVDCAERIKRGPEVRRICHICRAPATTYIELRGTY